MAVLERNPVMHFALDIPERIAPKVRRYPNPEKLMISLLEGFFESDKNIEEKNKESSVFDMIGANEGSGLYKNAQEIDEIIRKQREEWD